MPKFPSFPTLYDSVLKISMSKLISWGYLKPNQIINSNMNWNRNGNKTAEIGILINTINSGFSRNLPQMAAFFNRERLPGERSSLGSSTKMNPR